jgi:hypothetical protein
MASTAATPAPAAAVVTTTPAAAATTAVQKISRQGSGWRSLKQAQTAAQPIPCNPVPRNATKALAAPAQPTKCINITQTMSSPVEESAGPASLSTPSAQPLPCQAGSASSSSSSTIQCKVECNQGDACAPAAAKPAAKCTGVKRKAQANKDAKDCVKREGISFEALSKFFHMPLVQTAKDFGVCATVLKKRCRELGIKRWPYRKVRSLNRSVDKTETNTDKTVLEAQITAIQTKDTHVQACGRAKPRRAQGKKPSGVRAPGMGGIDELDFDPSDASDAEELMMEEGQFMDGGGDLLYDTLFSSGAADQAAPAVSAPSTPPYNQYDSSPYCSDSETDRVMIPEATTGSMPPRIVISVHSNAQPLQQMAPATCYTTTTTTTTITTTMSGCEDATQNRPHKRMRAAEESLLLQLPQASPTSVASAAGTQDQCAPPLTLSEYGSIAFANAAPTFAQAPPTDFFSATGWDDVPGFEFAEELPHPSMDILPMTYPTLAN